MPGRPPKPTKIHLIEGTGRKARLAARSGELNLEAAIPDAPDWMPPEAQREWGRLTSDAKYVKALAKVDRAMLTTFCILWAHFVEGERPPRPDESVEETLARAKAKLTPTEIMVMVNLGAKLGLNPCDRVKLRTPESAKKSNKFASLG